MKWSLSLGKIAGIGVYVHATFVLMIGWVALSHWMQGHSLAATLLGVGFILTIFACVVLHEFGLAFAARRYGIKHPGEDQARLLLAVFIFPTNLALVSLARCSRSWPGLTMIVV